MMLIARIQLNVKDLNKVIFTFSIIGTHDALEYWISTI